MYFYDFINFYSVFKFAKYVLIVEKSKYSIFYFKYLRLN